MSGRLFAWTECTSAVVKRYWAGGVREWVQHGSGEAIHDHVVHPLPTSAPSLWKPATIVPYFRTHA